MDLTTLIGAAVGLAVVALAMVRGGSPADFIDLNALVITVGGTVAATLINYPLPRLKAAVKGLRTVFRAGGEEPGQVIETLVGYAERARREGVLALEPDAEAAEDRFLRKGLQLLVDGTDYDEIRAILESDIAALEVRNRQAASLFETMAQFAPGFGMVGTLIGLVRMLRQMNSTAALGLTMATALLSTFYGVLLANLALLPVAGGTLLERQVALAWALGPAEVWVAGRAQADLGSVKARGILDAVPDAGPLGGLAAVLEATRARHVLLLAVDLPAVTQAFLSRVAAARAPGVGVAPFTASGWEPTAAVYPAELAPAVRRALAAGRRTLRLLVDEAVAAGRLRALPVDAAETSQLVNWNRPGDWRP